MSQASDRRKRSISGVTYIAHYHSNRTKYRADRSPFSRRPTSLLFDTLYRGGEWGIGSRSSTVSALDRGACDLGASGFARVSGGTAAVSRTSSHA